MTELVQPTASVLDPAGTREYRVVILFSRTVALQISTLSDSGFDYDHDKTIVDAIAQSVTPG